MSTPVEFPIILPAPPAGWSTSSAGTAGSLSAPVKHTVFAAGPSFIRSTVRGHLQRTFAEDDAIHAAHADSLKAGDAEELGPEFDGLGEEQESADTLALDPKEWKKQDHYAVLGLSHLRYQANDEHIKVAHRRKVLRHHPDKKANSGDSNNDSFFKCIQKAHESLTSLDRRRQFDSVDWEIEDAIPNAASVPAAKYVATFGPVFAREGRFSKRQPVPAFGTDASSKQEVEGFYDFWYKFDSWRSFEWWDKEANEGSDSRDEKRYAEKKNKSERARRKQEDNIRVRELVDSVLANDPRIKRIRAEEKAARDAKKNKGGAGGGKPVLSAKEKKEAEEKAAAEKKIADEAAKKQEAEDKVAREANKKAKEAAKKNLKKFKKALSTVLSSPAVNYFAAAGASAPASAIEAVLGELDVYAAAAEPEEVKALKEAVEPVAEDQQKVKAAFAEAAAKLVAAGKVEEAKFVQFK